MSVKKKVVRKKATTKKKTSTIGSYVRKVNAQPAVKRAAKTIKDLEAKLKKVKAVKAKAVKVARKKVSSGK